MAICKRILHFIESEGVYGAEKVILNLSRQLTIGGDFVPVLGCIVPNSSSTSALHDTAISLGFESIKIPVSNFRMPFDLVKAAFIIKAAKIDLIHSHGYKASVFGSAIYPINRIPVMATCHLWFNPEKGPLKMRVMIALEKMFYKWFPCIIAVSDPIQEILLKSGLDKNKIKIINNGVDIPDRITDTHRKEIRQQLGITDDTFCIINSARLTEQKAQWILIEAARLLKQKGIKTKFLIVGEGELHEKLHNLISLSNLDDVVSLLGFRNDVVHLLQAADLFVLPSIDEGMPISLLEAAAVKTPIVTTAVGDICKLVQHKQSGWIIRLNDPTALVDVIEYLFNNPAIRNGLAQRAFEQMSGLYSSSAMCKSYTGVYRSLV